MWENNSDLQSPASTRLVVLQLIVRFWKESSSTRIQSLDAGLSKQQISNLLNSQGAVRAANTSPLVAIQRFSDPMTDDHRR